MENFVLYVKNKNSDRNERVFCSAKNIYDAIFQAQGIYPEAEKIRGEKIGEKKEIIMKWLEENDKTKFWLCKRIGIKSEITLDRKIKENSFTDEDIIKLNSLGIYLK